MAGSGYGRRASAKKRTGSHNKNTYTYIDGNTVRKLEVQPVSQPKKPQGESGEVSPGIRRNRERALQMNFRYVLFLTAAAVVTVFVCVNFLQLRAVNTLLAEDVASLSAELDSAILDNDSEYNRVINSVDLEHVKEVATNELGMQQATSDQIVTYEVEDGDYVRQYSEIPTE
ncbi:MAG: cell division protein FtsL [Lachnospiraceae bacterium]|nr:cell division protein FtsL [Lachnospiraceae bacterium]